MEFHKIDFIQKLEGDVEFDVHKYHHEIPHGWEVLPRSLPLRVRNNFY